MFSQTQLQCKYNASGNHVVDEMNDQYETLPDEQYYDERAEQRVAITSNVTINSHVKTDCASCQCLLR